MWRASASAASTWSRIAAVERRLDHPYATYLTIRSGRPGPASAVTVARARSSSLSTLVIVPCGPSTSWSIAAAHRSPLDLVMCTIAARRSLLVESSP